MHAYSELNLKLTTGIFGSTFFMLTGFHGFHVTVGAIMLAVILVRAIRGHFDAEHHFAFEAAAWYWHFVDVVWLEPVRDRLHAVIVHGHPDKAALGPPSHLWLGQTG